MSSVDALYYEVAEIVRSVLAKEQSVRTAVYGSNYKNKKTLLKLTCETMKFKSVFEAILKDPDLKTVLSDPMVNGNVYLAYVLLHEFLAGPGLNRASPKLKAVIMRKGKEIKDQEKLLAEEGKGVQAIREAEKNATKPVAIPRYARINTLKWTREEALKALEDEQWKVVELPSDVSFSDRCTGLANDEVLVDPHVENLLVFAVAPDFHTYWMVEQRYLILQDKASCLPAFLLSPPENSQVFDTCAAPGMKTSHVAAIMNGTGKVWAMDRAEDRVETMRSLLELSGCTSANVFHGDFLKTNVKDKQFAKVKYAIVDPPCSGSGIVKRMDELTGGNSDQGRLDKLKNLQAMILKHAMKLPALEKVVYSTCSIHEEENEQVVDEVLLDTYVRRNFRLCHNVLPSWTHRGVKSYADVGEHCLRADPRVTLTNGFFVAVFERLESDDE